VAPDAEMTSACARNDRAMTKVVDDTAATTESETSFTQWNSRLSGEPRRFQHYRAEPVGCFTGWRPAIPVTQWAVVKR
jgi:precorrin-6B methylase 2